MPTQFIPVTVTHRDPERNITTTQVTGETTPTEYLVITPGFSEGKFSDLHWLVHAPTGLQLTRGFPDKLREIAARLSHLDWENVTTNDFPQAKQAARVIKEAQFTDPTAVELPAHDAWGPDGRGQGLQRAAIPMAEAFLADLHHNSQKLSGDNAVPLDVPDPESPGGTRVNPMWTFSVSRKVQDFGLVYLLLVLNRVDPEVADSAAGFLADAWHTGDAVDEWAWEWQQALAKGEVPVLRGVPELGELFPGPVG